MPSSSPSFGLGLLRQEHGVRVAAPPLSSSPIRGDYFDGFFGWWAEVREFGVNGEYKRATDQLKRSNHTEALTSAHSSGLGCTSNKDSPEHASLGSIPPRPPSARQPGGHPAVSVCCVWAPRTTTNGDCAGNPNGKAWFWVAGKAHSRLTSKGIPGGKEPNSGGGEPKESLPYARVPRPALWFSQLRPLGGWSVFPSPLWRYHTEPFSCSKVPRW